jgi:arylsulfatase A-like enzyme
MLNPKRWVIHAVAVGCAAGLPGASCDADAEQPATRRPNIVLVFIDDMGWGDLSCFGNDAVRTDNVDRLAAEGIRFEQFYVNSPICSPSRVAISTGQYPQRWRITSYLNNRRSNRERGLAQWLDPAAPMLARILSDAGYATGHFGKWHMGGQRDVGEAPLITEYGFDASLTNFEGLGPRVLPRKDAYDGRSPQPHALGSDKLGRGPIRWEDRSRVTAAFTAAAVQFVRQASSQNRPFYVNLWPDDVHSPFFPPRGRRGDGSKRTRYHAVLETMDEQFGPLLDLIRGDEVLRTNTLILICSDNGPERGAGSAGPFRGYKTHLYEGGIRSPLIAWGPGLIEAAAAGTVNRSSVLAAIDLVPSLLAIAGIDPPAGVAFDGQALPGVLTGNSTASREGPLFFRRPPDRDAFYGVDDLPDLAVRDGRWKLLCEYDGSDAALFDLETDRAEDRNVAQRHPDVARRLAGAAVQWHASMPADNGPEYARQRQAARPGHPSPLTPSPGPASDAELGPTDRDRSPDVPTRPGPGRPTTPVTLNRKGDGYRGIWYMNQPSDDEYKYKYSGGLGTYCAKHQPFAVYCPAAERTYFCYGGTTADSYRRLLHMVSYYDHRSGKVPRPTILLDKRTDDAHDNPVLAVDDRGYIWVFSTSHGTSRPSYVHRGTRPYSIDQFELIVPRRSEGSRVVPITNFSYMQAWHVPGEGFACFFTRYGDPTDRTLFFMASRDGVQWSDWQRLAAIEKGHYQISAAGVGRAGSAFNYHPDPRGLNWRTNLYYIETRDGGRSWQSADGHPLDLPLRAVDSAALVREYRARGLNVYLKDVVYDHEGHPVILYLTSGGYASGPANDPRTWTTVRWTGRQWVERPVTTSDHNYDMGSLWIEPDGTWRLIGPTQPGPQAYNPGGEVAMWVSRNRGDSWQMTRQLTSGSDHNHTYVRRPVAAHSDFYALWADGNARAPSPSRLYFCDREGNVYLLPPQMDVQSAVPAPVGSL